VREPGSSRREERTKVAADEELEHAGRRKMRMTIARGRSRREAEADRARRIAGPDVIAKANEDGSFFRELDSRRPAGDHPAVRGVAPHARRRLRHPAPAIPRAHARGTRNEFSAQSPWRCLSIGTTREVPARGRAGLRRGSGWNADRAAACQSSSAAEDSELGDAERRADRRAGSWPGHGPGSRDRAEAQQQQRS